MKTAIPATCTKCHPGSDTYTASHRDGQIKLSSRINNSPTTTQYPDNNPPFNNTTTAFPQTHTPQPGSCYSVNCHFEKQTPTWGTQPLISPDNCSTCHDAPPFDGSHRRKHDTYFGVGTESCLKCHSNHLSDPNHFSHATSAGKRPLSIQFTTSPNSGGTYGGDVSYPGYLPSQNPSRNGACNNIYCHSDGRGGPSNVPTLTWSDSKTSQCYSCHKGRSTRAGDSTPQISDNTEANCIAILGIWSSSKGYCTPELTMTSNGHHRLTGPQWIRKYPCYYCHNNTVALDGTLTNISSMAKHVNGKVDVVMASKWNIVGRPMASYSSSSKVCNNVYCHSDGTTDPEDVRPFPWTAPKTECNTCHGHPTGSCANASCHDGRTDSTGKVWTVKTGWNPGSEWMGSMPMFPSQGAGTARANSHPRHSQSDFTCDNCHAATVANGSCKTCHNSGIPPGGMGEVSHINAAFHVNKAKDVVFKDGGTYNADKSCSNTKCHKGQPVWGDSVNGSVTCFNCHGNTVDVDVYAGFRNATSMAKISESQWLSTGHGRYSTSGRYPASGNPAANFPTANPCWYCHDNNVLHGYTSNRFRLRMHPQYSKRFEKECVYCHMEGKDYECLNCHNNAESLAPQINSIFKNETTAKWPDGTSVVRYDHAGYSTCMDIACHYVNPGDPKKDAKVHNVGAGLWNVDLKADIKNQYMMMGVCLQCHDDDSGGQCTSCHTAPAEQPFKYSLGFDPGMTGTRYIKPKQARASASHFGYKHYRAYQKDGTWKGGKFCWNCHDPHGDSNIYMIHDKVATTTDERLGVPKTLADVVFTQKVSGNDYVRIKDPQNPDLPINGICNVCHSSNSKHFTKDGGDSHNIGRVCTNCHEHRFADSHADKQACNSCHTKKKPVPKHNAFGLPRDCTKCHSGSVGRRMDVMGQFKSNSHHVQGVDVNNKQCYVCHWESTSSGTIDPVYHEGYDFNHYTSVKNAKVDLVVWKPGLRPTYYNTTTAIQFVAVNIGTPAERTEVAKINNHCLSCHSDQNNNTTPFNDCKTPRQYAWDSQSIAARYSQNGTTTWGKYNSASYPNANKKDTIPKALSAHGNAVANQGGWSAATGYDSAIPVTRGSAGTQNVQCFDCHNSHGSKAGTVTSSYVTFNGSKNGGNLKETQKGKGGYNTTYKAVANPGSPNPYNTGAGQCFDCHENATVGTTGPPWGYSSTFGATAPVMGYLDTSRFGQSTKGSVARYPFRDSRKTIISSHLKAQKFLNYSAQGTIDGLCTPCHDPHGVSPTLGANQAYGVPLLKGTWMTSPYRDDNALANPSGQTGIRPEPPWRIDRNTLSTNMYDNSNRIRENDTQFAGLCLQCHRKEKLTDGVNRNTAFKTLDRTHETVQGWGVNNEHSFACSKCHQPHNSGLPRLMQTNCLDVQHRGYVASGGYPNKSGWRGGNWWGFPRGAYVSLRCHSDDRENGQRLYFGHLPEYPNNYYWNNVTPWPQL